jgi:hypothetical protein
MIEATPKDPLEVPVGPVTRFRAKRFRRTFNGLVVTYFWVPTQKYTQMRKYNMYIRKKSKK